MYYADEPRKERTRPPMSKEVKVIGLVSGIALVFMPVILSFSFTVGWLFVIFPSFMILDITAFSICMINPATPERRKVCKVLAIIGAAAALLLFVYCMLVALGYLPQPFMISI